MSICGYMGISYSLPNPYQVTSMFTTIFYFQRSVKLKVYQPVPISSVGSSYNIVSSMTTTSSIFGFITSPERNTTTSIPSGNVSSLSLNSRTFIIITHKQPILLVIYRGIPLVWHHINNTQSQ